jgi:hypothetical protein
LKPRFPIALSLLLLAGGAGAQTSEKSYAAFPTGEGDPDAITCRPPQPMPGEPLNGPEVCKTNAIWARYRRDGMDVAPDGVRDIPLRNKSGLNCRSVSAGAGGSTMSAGNMSMHCD